MTLLVTKNMSKIFSAWSTATTFHQLKPERTLGFTTLSISILAVFTCTTHIEAQNSKPTATPIVNGKFQDWAEGLPTGWTIAVGAQNGQGEKSTIESLEGGGLCLKGKASTRIWHSIAQSISVEPGSRLAIRFAARQENVRREGNQYDNCFVGLFFFDANRKGFGAQVEPVVWKNWTDRTLVAQVPAGSTECDVTIFLSKTGTLQVRSVVIAGDDDSEPFDNLMDALSNHYSFAQLKNVDWNSLAKRYGPTASAATTPESFINAIKPMLAELEDMHVWCVDPNGMRTHCYSSGYASNVSFPAIRKRLVSEKMVDKSALVGRTKNKLGYVAIRSLNGSESLFAEVSKEVASLFDCQAIIFDLRKNSGGNERYAQDICGLFATKPLIYAKSIRRNGPNADDFGAPSERWLRPTTDKPFDGPVACLVGPGCVSSGEGFALMMAALPNAKLFGQPTRGASGNPAPVLLSNGVQVFFSRWVSQTPEGTSIEGKGVQPDELVKHVVGDSDLTFNAAWKYLKSELKQH